MIETDIKALNERIQKESAFVDLLTLEMHKVIIGQKQMIERLLIGLLSNGHILLEGVPGLAKTLAIKSLAGIIVQISGPIQFTPDLLSCRPYRNPDIQPEERRVHGKERPHICQFHPCRRNQQVTRKSSECAA